MMTTRNLVQDLLSGAALQDWRRRGTTPDRLLVRPADPWGGDAMAGQAILENGLPGHGGTYIHGFSWLRDLRAEGSSAARLCARGMTESWIRDYGRRDLLAWRADITGARITHWIACQEFFYDDGDCEFYEIFLASLMRQARHLRRTLSAHNNDLAGLDLLRAAQGLLYAGIGFEGCEAWVVQALEHLVRACDEQILSDGCHISRAPGQLLGALQILLEVKTALGAAGYPAPDAIQQAIDRGGIALRFFRCPDRGLALFHGTQENDPALIEAVLAQAGSSLRTLGSLPAGGYERLMQGRTSVLFDCGGTPPRPHDRDAHAAPLSFEMSYGKDRVFVTCGSHPHAPEWRDALRATAAHNTLVIDDRNAGDIRPSGHFARRVRVTDARRDEAGGSVLVQATHDGYVPLGGLVHTRRLYLADQGHDLRGEDILSAAGAPTRCHDAALRFHVHPRVMVSLTQSGDEALLRMPTGMGWRFHQSGGTLALEDSIYLGQGKMPRKTKQLVIRAPVAHEDLRLKWALQRESV